MTTIPFKEFDQLIEFFLNGNPKEIKNGRITVYIKNGVAWRTQVIDDKSLTKEYN